MGYPTIVKRTDCLYIGGADTEIEFLFINEHLRDLSWTEILKKYEANEYDEIEFFQGDYKITYSKGEATIYDEVLSEDYLNNF